MTGRVSSNVLFFAEHQRRQGEGDNLHGHNCQHEPLGARVAKRSAAAFSLEIVFDRSAMSADPPGRVMLDDPTISLYDRHSGQRAR